MPDLERFLAAAVRSAEHTAEALGVGQVVHSSAQSEPHDSGVGLELFSDVLTLDVALFACTRAVRLVAFALTELEEPREILDDSLREFLNIVGGGMKQSLFERLPNLRLGLPRSLALADILSFGRSAELSVAGSRFTLAVRAPQQYSFRQL